MIGHRIGSAAFSATARPRTQRDGWRILNPTDQQSSSAAPSPKRQTRRALRPAQPNDATDS
jgi:hypothetical protein